MHREIEALLRFLRQFVPVRSGTPASVARGGSVQSRRRLIWFKYCLCTESLRTTVKRDGEKKNLNVRCSRGSESSSETGSSWLSGSLGGVSVCQLLAALLIPSTTSWICGLRLLSPSQHFWISLHKESEIPMFSGFSGLSGRAPSET